MLKRLDAALPKVNFAKAQFPEPFHIGLEYNPPEHEHWNIVNIGMQVPESIQVYICADNCMRGVVMTAYEMAQEERFCCVTICEADVFKGNMEEQMIEGVSEAIDRQFQRPKMVICFPVCTHRIMATDMTYVYKTLRARYPDIDFVEAWMDCLLQKEHILPDYRLRKLMYGPIQKRPLDHSVALLGSEVLHQDHSDLTYLLKDYEIKQLQNMRSYEEFLDLGAISLTIATIDAGKMANEDLAKRLEIPSLYMPATYDYKEIDALEEQLCKRLAIKERIDLKDACEEAYEKLLKEVGDRPIAIDYTANPRPLSLARFLIDHGFHVTTIYAEAFLEEERQDFEYLQEHAPDLIIEPTIHTGMIGISAPHLDALAIGPKAAYFQNTSHFVNMIEGGGLFGYHGILEMAHLMHEAIHEEKDLEAITQKAMGWEALK